MKQNKTQNKTAQVSKHKTQEEKRKLSVTKKEILGKGNNLYLVCWSRIANFGYELIRADTEEEAMKNHAWAWANHVNCIITLIDESNMPMVKKGNGE